MELGNFTSVAMQYKPLITDLSIEKGDINY